MSQGNSIWVVRMPNEPPQEAEPTPERIQEFLQENPLVANSFSELEQDRAFARNVLGQIRFLAEVSQFFAPYSEDFNVQVRFLSWQDAFWQIKSCYWDYVVKNGDVMVVEVPSTWCSHYAAEGMLRDLSSWVDYSRFSQTTLDWYRWDKGLYAVPCDLDLRLVFYNKAMLKPEDFVSLDAFLSACKRVMEKEKRPRAVLGIPTGVGFDSFHILEIWLWNMGLGDIGSEDKSLLFGNEDPLLEGNPVWNTVNLLADMRTKGYLSAPEATTRDVVDDFLAGRFGMVVLGPWVIKRKQDISDHGIDVGITLPPNMGASGRFTFEGGGGMGICAGSYANRSVVTLAERFLEFYTNEQNELIHSQVTGYLPAHLEAQKASELFKQIGQESGWTPQNSRIYPRRPEWAPYVEHLTAVDTLVSFWRVLQAISPQQKEDISSSRRLLLNHLATMNRRIEQVSQVITEHAEREKAEAKGKVIGYVLDSTAHRLKNRMLPVTQNLRWAIDLLVSQLPTDNLRLEDVAKYCITALKRAEEIDEALNMWLDVVKKGDHPLPNFLSGTDLVQIIGEAVKGQVKDNANIHVRNDSESDLPYVRVNLSDLKCDFENFIVDSQRHFDLAQRDTDELIISIRGEKVSAESDPKVLNLAPGVTYLKLIYTDNGPGIPKDWKDRIFEKGYTTTPHGNGQGLAIAKENARNHKGELVERGKYGEGVQFELYIPEAMHS